MISIAMLSCNIISLIFIFNHENRISYLLVLLSSLLSTSLLFTNIELQLVCLDIGHLLGLYSILTRASLKGKRPLCTAPFLFMIYPIVAFTSNILNSELGMILYLTNSIIVLLFRYYFQFSLVLDSQYLFFISVDNLWSIFAFIEQLDILVSHSLFIVKQIVLSRGLVLLITLGLSRYLAYKRIEPERELLLSTESAPTMYDSTDLPVQENYDYLEPPTISATWIIGNDDNVDNDSSMSVHLETNLLGTSF
ncbi:hypothetical protein HDV04_004100 [Boothiomyces sp. JEL0838]|nr:hypothetical protein HDV04_004087 [Boothiomyces sp. JEL0838]KAJ3311388.1 hypothetical protein HDV04_004100 [Boothiomyces sp. JEL0838]